MTRAKPEKRLNVRAFTLPLPILQNPAPIALADVSPAVEMIPRTCTLTELSRLTGRSVYVVKGWLSECHVPIYGRARGRHIVVDDLAVRRPEIFRLFERRAEKRDRGEHVRPDAWADDEAA